MQAPSHLHKPEVPQVALRPERPLAPPPAPTLAGRQIRAPVQLPLSQIRWSRDLPKAPTAAARPEQQPTAPRLTTMLRLKMVRRPAEHRAIPRSKSKPRIFAGLTLCTLENVNLGGRKLVGQFILRPVIPELLLAARSTFWMPLPIFQRQASSARRPSSACAYNPTD